MYEIWPQIKHTPEASAIPVHQSRLYSQVGGRGLRIHLSTAELSSPSLWTSVLVSSSYHLHYHLFLVSLPLTMRLRRQDFICPDIDVISSTSSHSSSSSSSIPYITRVSSHVDTSTDARVVVSSMETRLDLSRHRRDILNLFSFFLFVVLVKIWSNVCYSDTLFQGYRQG